MQSLALILGERRFRSLISGDMSRVLLSESVDCHARSEAIAHHWFRAGVLVDAAVERPSILEKGDVPALVHDIVAESEKDLTVALSTWTCCSCLNPRLARPQKKDKPRFAGTGACCQCPGGCASVGADAVPATVDASVLASARPSMPLSSPEPAGECSQGMEERAEDAASPSSNQVPRMVEAGLEAHALAEAPLGPAAVSDALHAMP